MKDTTKYKSVSFPAPDRINLAKPVKTIDILYKKVFGKGQKTVQGKGIATQGTKFNRSPSGHR
jgi:CxxC motif-containing protein